MSWLRRWTASARPRDAQPRDVRVCRARGVARWHAYSHAHARASVLLATLALGIASLAPVAAHAQSPRFSFAVVSDTMQSPTDEAPTVRLLDAISRERALSFVVYDGNLKGATEACRDSLYENRQTVLETSKAPLFFVPGGHDWADCGTAQAGGYDPVERLDQLRQTLLSDPTSLGQNPLPLTRESEVSRFRPYRENVRWLTGDTVFIGLNVPGPNNHYLYGGGRNGEFEDRVIANAFWLDHAAEFARRRSAHAVVIFMQADPDPERYERPERFAWLRFARNEHRDGFLELKRSLVKLAETFRGPVLLIHAADTPIPGGFRIDQPLRNDKGIRVDNLTRIEIAPRDRLNQWIQIDADMVKRPPFRVSVRDVPKRLPMPPSPTTPPNMEPAPSMPEVPTLPPASELAPVPHETGPGAPPAFDGQRNGMPGTLPSSSPVAPVSPSSSGQLSAPPQSPQLPPDLPPILPTTPTPTPASPASAAAGSVQRGP